jgi:hypothetical protein
MHATNLALNAVTNAINEFGVLFADVPGPAGPPGPSGVGPTGPTGPPGALAAAVAAYRLAVTSRKT